MKQHRTTYVACVGVKSSCDTFDVPIIPAKFHTLQQSLRWHASHFTLGYPPNTYPRLLWSSPRSSMQWQKTEQQPSSRYSLLFVSVYAQVTQILLPRYSDKTSSNQRPQRSPHGPVNWCMLLRNPHALWTHIVRTNSSSAIAANQPLIHNNI